MALNKVVRKMYYEEWKSISLVPEVLQIEQNLNSIQAEEGLLHSTIHESDHNCNTWNA